MTDRKVATNKGYVSYTFQVRRLPMFAIVCPICDGLKTFALSIDVQTSCNPEKQTCTCQPRPLHWWFWAAAVLKGEV